MASCFPYSAAEKQAALERADYRCECCGRGGMLEIHHGPRCRPIVGCRPCHQHCYHHGDFGLGIKGGSVCQLRSGMTALFRTANASRVRSSSANSSERRCKAYLQLGGRCGNRIRGQGRFCGVHAHL